MTNESAMAADELLLLPEDAFRYELVDGRLRKAELRRWRDGVIIGNLHGMMHGYIHTQQLGCAFAAGTGFLIQQRPDTVLAPALAFICADHLPSTDPDDAYWPGAPDLAVEVISPGDARGKLPRKSRRGWPPESAKCGLSTENAKL